LPRILLSNCTGSTTFWRSQKRNLPAPGQVYPDPALPEKGDFDAS